MPRAICVIATAIDADISIRALEIVIGEPVTLGVGWVWPWNCDASRTPSEEPSDRGSPPVVTHRPELIAINGSLIAYPPKK